MHVRERERKASLLIDPERPREAHRLVMNMLEVLLSGRNEELERQTVINASEGIWSLQQRESYDRIYHNLTDRMRGFLDWRVKQTEEIWALEELGLLTLRFATHYEKRHRDKEKVIEYLQQTEKSVYRLEAITGARRFMEMHYFIEEKLANLEEDEAARACKNSFVGSDARQLFLKTKEEAWVNRWLGKKLAAIRDGTNPDRIAFDTCSAVEAACESYWFAPSQERYALATILYDEAKGQQLTDGVRSRIDEFYENVAADSLNRLSPQSANRGSSPARA